MKIVLVTGGFDPLHSGHIAYFQAARKLGDQLIVGLNSDEWLARKKGQPFMPLTERRAIVGSLKDVAATVVYNDDDNSSCHAIETVLSQLNNDDELIFANGGDRTKENIPEMRITDPRVKFVFGVGGENKMNSSSWILREWKNPKTDRLWGYYRVLHEVPGCKVKELTIEPGRKMSFQRHEHRSEYWIVTNGKCDLISALPKGYMLPIITLNQHDTQIIPRKEWHQLSNPYSEPCSIVEIQYGTSCTEEDIERKEI